MIFFTKYFLFLEILGSFQGQGNFGALGMIFGCYSSMPSIKSRFDTLVSEVKFNNTVVASSGAEYRSY